MDLLLMGIYVASLLFLILNNLLLVMQIQTNYIDLFAELKDPGLFCLVKTPWTLMQDKEFESWLWSTKHLVMGDRKLSYRVYKLRLSIILYYVCLFILISWLAFSQP